MLFAPSNKTSLVNLRESVCNHGWKIKTKKKVKTDLESCQFIVYHYCKAVVIRIINEIHVKGSILI